MTYHELFKYIKEKFIGADVSGFKSDVAYQFNVRGEGEGAFYAEVKNNVLFIEPYEYYDRNVIFECDSQVLLDIADGKLDPEKAAICGKLKFEGDIQKALEFKKIFDAIYKKPAKKAEKTAAETAETKTPAAETVDETPKPAPAKTQAETKKTASKKTNKRKK